jgi:hypothetical protein
MAQTVMPEKGAGEVVSRTRAIDIDTVATARMDRMPLHAGAIGVQQVSGKMNSRTVNSIDLREWRPRPPNNLALARSSSGDVMGTSSSGHSARANRSRNHRSHRQGFEQRHGSARLSNLTLARPVARVLANSQHGPMRSASRVNRRDAPAANRPLNHRLEKARVSCSNGAARPPYTRRQRHTV